MPARRGQRRFRGLAKMQMRSIPMSDEMFEGFKLQTEAFEAKFGRPPGPHDRVFFNPDSDVSEPMSEQQIAGDLALIGDAMRRAGVDPANIYAYEKTGFLATERNWPLLDAGQRHEWLAAIAEYDAVPDDDQTALTGETFTMARWVTES
jgi:hypothetical protein